MTAQELRAHAGHVTMPDGSAICVATIRCGGPHDGRPPEIVRLGPSDEAARHLAEWTADEAGWGWAPGIPMLPRLPRPARPVRVCLLCRVRVEMADGTPIARELGMATCTARLPSARIPPELLTRIRSAIGDPRAFSSWIRDAAEEKLSRDAEKVRTKVRTTAK